jgi:hypothetical protein
MYFVTESNHDLDLQILFDDGLHRIYAL